MNSKGIGWLVSCPSERVDGWATIPIRIVDGFSYESNNSMDGWLRRALRDWWMVELMVDC